MTLGSARPVYVAREFDASPEAVFDAWLEPGLIQRWMFRSPTNEICEVHCDRRAGGEFAILVRADGDLIDHFGEYLEIDRPRRLVFTLQVPKHFPSVTRVEVTIAPAATGCSLTLIQSGVDRDVTEHAWRSMLETLASLCTGSG